MRYLRRRTALLLVGLLYAVLVSFTYSSLVVPLFEYWGLGPLHASLWYRGYSFLLALLPLLWLPDELARPSAVPLWLLYLLLYVPAELLAYGVTEPVVSPGRLAVLGTVTCIGIAIVSIGAALPIREIARPRLSQRTAILIVGCVTATMLIYFFRSEGQYASFSLDFVDIYDARSALRERVARSEGSALMYVQLWLAGFCFPTLAALLWGARRRLAAVFCAFGPVTLFAVNGLKGMLFSPLLTVGILFLGTVAARRFGVALVGSVALAVAVGIPISLAFPGVGTWYTALLHFRLLAVPAELYIQYFDFFSTHPLTYLSHVQGFSSLHPYPYDGPLPQIIGNYYYGLEQDGANATSWAMDGLAGFGLPGVLIASALMAIVLYVLDSLAEGADARWVAAATGYVALVLTSSSLFTTLLSGGFILLLFFLLWWPARAESEVRSG